jgi:hypothetical protein
MMESLLKMTLSTLWDFFQLTALQMTNLDAFSSNLSLSKTLSLLFLSVLIAKESSVFEREVRPSLKTSEKIKNSPFNKNTSTNRRIPMSFLKRKSKTIKYQRDLRLNKWHHKR